MEAELRRHFHDRLGDLHARVEGMGDAAVGALRMSTPALLAGDRRLAGAVIAADAPLDAEYEAVEAEVLELFALQAPVGRDLRFLLATLRVAQELERCGDLAASIARRAGRIQSMALTPTIRTGLRAMGDRAVSMVSAAVGAFRVVDAHAARTVTGWDDGMDELHRRLLRHLFALGAAPVEPAIELGLVARFYERIADHAVVIAERVCLVATGAADHRQPGRSSLV